MNVTWYPLDDGRLTKGPAPAGWLSARFDPGNAIWIDIEDPEPEQLRALLEPLELPALVLTRCLSSRRIPGAFSSESVILLQFPAVLAAEADDPVYLALVLRSGVLLTMHSAPLPALNNLVQELLSDKATNIEDPVQLMYLVLDHLADLSVRAEIEFRDHILRTGRMLAENAAEVDGAQLTRLRWQVDRLASLVENQLYAIVALKASDSPVLDQSHRNAYLQDLMSELELAQRGTYRLDSRVNDLYSYYQMTQSDQVERRLRILTIVSVIALPLGLIAGLLGMNVGGLPATETPWGFAIVLAFMVVMALVELLYFKRRGWFR